MKTKFCIFAIMLAFAGSTFVLAEDFTHKAFPHKLIFSETPEIGRKWRGGIRMNDILIWDMYFNVNDWFLIDFLYAGLPTGKPEEGGSITDKFSTITIKSRPFSIPLINNPYKIAGGIKLYSSIFSVTESTNDTLLSSNDSSGIFFLSQSYQWKEKHFFNLFSSLSFRERKLTGGAKKTYSTFYLIPGYMFRVSKNWFFAFEHYLTNTEKLPIKILQYALDEDELEFHNPDHEMVSWMFWGMHYSRKHFHADLNLCNHISFQGPVFPVCGIGWNF